MNYLIKVAYDGSRFYGFQRLNNHDTVQKRIEEALSIINKKDVLIKGAGRTDKGVHALDQGVTFKLDINITEDGLKKALNSLLEPYIYIKDVLEVDEKFHARFSAKCKQYIYKINLGEFNPILSDYVYQSEYKLDLDMIKKVGELYIGVHDFKNFVSGTRDNYEAIIYDIDYEINDDILSIIISGKSFYRYMVRNLVGMMIDVSRGKDNINKVKEMLNNKKEICGYTAPSCGLYLAKVEY